MKKPQSMVYKYFKIFILVLIIPIVIINIIVNDVFKKILLKNEQENLQKAIYQTSKMLNDDVKRISLFTSTIYNSRELMELINEWHIEKDTGKKLTLSREINQNLSYLFNFNNEVQSILFFFEDGQVYNHKNEPNISYAQITEMGWYRDVKEHRGEVAVLSPRQELFTLGAEKFILSAAIAPEKHEINNQIDMVYVALKADIPNKYYADPTLMDKQGMYIIGEDNTILVAENKELIGQDIEKTGIKKEIFSSQEDFILSEIDENKVLVTFQSLKKRDWKLVGIIDYKYITRDINRLNSYIWGLYSALFVIFILYSIFYFKDILMPIKKLVKKMAKVERGDFQTTMVCNENSEINDLALAFNKMVSEINNLIKERDYKEKERNHAELEMLQSQINPHFLSNTLNAIRFMAMMAKVDNISRVTEALIKLLHASFAKTGKYITVEEEIEHLKSYLHIMEIRYVNQFKITIEIEEALKKHYMLRLLLQPIVENAILYGVNASEKETEIRVIGTLEEEVVLFEIIDYGVGMSAQQIEEVLHRECRNEKGFTHIGIANVNKRIKLNDGEQYGISITSEVGAYTKVNIRLPLLKEVKGEEVHV